MSLERAGHRRAPALGVCIAVGLVLAAAGAAPVAAANNVRVLAYYGDCQFAGSQAGSGRTVKIDWRDSDGNLKSKHSVTSNSAGSFVSRCEFGELIEKGDVFKTTIGTTVRSFVVPMLTLTASRQTDAVSGLYDPTPNSLLVQAITYNGGFSLATASLHTSTPSLCCPNQYVADVWDTSPDLKGWDDVYAQWSNARGDSFIRYRPVEGIRVWVRQPFVDFAVNPGDPIQVSLSRGSELLGQITAMANHDGRFYGEFLDRVGDPVRIRAGDVVTHNSEVDFAFEVPSITATINKSTDRIAVSCGLGAHVGIEVHVRPRDFSKLQSRAGFTNASGVFLANFATTPTYNVISGDKIDVYCKFAPGDVVAKTFTVA